MKTNLPIAVVVLVIVITISVGVYFQTQNVMAKETPFQAGYDHGCADSKLTLSERYIEQPSKDPQEFMTGYNTVFNICRSDGQFSPIVVSNIDIANNNNSSSLSFKQGHANGVSDAKLEKDKFPVSTIIMKPDDVDCDSDIDPRMSNEEYCSGYQHGFADTINNR